MKIAIIGAGISGLTTAFYLQRARPDWKLVIYEAERVPGGTMHTADLEGFLFEAGGNGFLTNKPDSLKLVEDSGAKELLMPSSDLARKRYIYDGALHRLPESPKLFLQSRLLSLPQKLRVGWEFFVPPRRDGADETLQQFGYRRVGKGFTDVFLDAMVAGIYATTPDRISVRAAFPLVAALEQEHGGLFRGMLAKRKKEAGPGGILMSFRGGVSRFIEHLHRSIDAEWHLGEPVSRIARRDGGYEIHTAAGASIADQVVICAQPYAAADMVANLDFELANQLAAIEYSPVAVVGMGFRSLAHTLDGFGLLTTTAARLNILGVLWDSSIFPDRAPPQCKAVRVMIGGQRNPELVGQDEAGLIATAREGIAVTMGIDQEPDVVFVKRWERGIASYTPGHVARMDALFARLSRHAGLHLTCNAYRGIAMNDSVRNARELAMRIAAQAAGQEAA